MKSKIENIKDLPPLMPEAVAGSFLHKSPTSMWRLRKENLISFRRNGGTPYYTREDIEEYLERVKVAAAAA